MTYIDHRGDGNKIIFNPFSVEQAICDGRKSQQYLITPIDFRVNLFRRRKMSRSGFYFVIFVESLDDGWCSHFWTWVKQ